MRRLACCVPGCKRTIRADSGYGDWVCGKHWAAVSRGSKAEWRAAKRKVRKVWKRKPGYRSWWLYPPGSPERLAALRVWRWMDGVWRLAKDEAIEKAMGIR